TVQVEPGAIELRVVDHTPGFDLPSTNELPDPTAEGGRGLFLMRSLTDSIKYLRGRDENCLILRKRRVPPPREPSADVSMEQAMLEATLHTMTEELAASYESLSAIFRFTEDLNRTGGDTHFIERWMGELRQITGADWFILRLLDPRRTQLVVAQSFDPKLTLPPLPLEGNAVPSVELTAVKGRQDVWFDASDPVDPADPLARIAPVLSGLAHPLYVAGELAGVLAVGRFAPTNSFTAGQVNIIHTLADFLGIQIRNAEFQSATLQAQLIERDYEVASRIQRELLPKRHPKNGRWSTLGYCESAQLVGGDFYDIL